MRRWTVGFIVIALIIFLVTFIPYAYRDSHPPGEWAAIGSIKTIWAAQEDYYRQSNPHTYTGSLACLGSGNGADGVPLIDQELSSGVKSGYRVSLVPGPVDDDGIIHTWSSTTWPVVYRHRRKGLYGWILPSMTSRSFYIDETGIFRYGDNGGKKGNSSMRAIK